ncbi:Peptidoglycan/LPS O-acetylase OafA/YrhL, contains acyltransferase and SGNH-hydrolase domains [Streptomyces sp. cf386]|uniref:acyltransferase family protein n=1 Tax=Streptomyces sp. cf386 TaxID=1761904 RepID=UPI000883906A|nr:acyltransferase [Streptomyces sp. cf386]SDP81239.1 Peptidoglycan/LPS O-acetylase OafA/YrhL, contains acyltransferase and SGNH-hydrolase domains [Streptomyces sp. cf386]
MSTEKSRARVTRLNTLTGLRFPAAFVVFLYHAALLGFLGIPWLSSSSAVTTYYGAVAHVGALGVTFFFVLSGFVLTWSARKTDTAPRFWRRRFLKIVPNYVLVWALAMVVFAAPHTDVTVGALNLFLVQVWYPDFAINFGVNPAGWSLAVEAVFYLSFPVLFHVIKKIPAHRLNLSIAGVAAGILATPWLSTLLVPAGTVFMDMEPETSVNQYFFSYIVPLPRVLDFALGILVARSVMAGRWRNIGMIWSGALLAASYVVGYFTPYIYSSRAVCVVPAALLIAAGAIADDEGRFTFCRNRVMVWLGDISFAFYLVHYTVIVAVWKTLGSKSYSNTEAVALMALCLGVSILASWALYALVERPITQRWSNPRRKPVARGPEPEAEPVPLAAGRVVED